MSNPFIAKLEHGAHLSDDDRRKLQEITARARRVGPREDLIMEGEPPDEVRLVIEGFACRYKLLRDGARQICGYMVPGDICNLHVAILGEMDHSIATISACSVVDLTPSTVEELRERYPRITRALWWSTLVDEGVMREWLVGMGRRPADRRMAHLFCELFTRLGAVGRVERDAFELPLTQAELGDALGLSLVHVNRVLQALRDDGLVSFRRRVLQITDVGRLQSFAEFNANYLHLTKAWDRAPLRAPRSLPNVGGLNPRSGEFEA